MLELDDDDPPFLKHVERQVTLDMLDTEELVQELIKRKVMIIITARRRVPSIVYNKPNFYSAIQAILACDLAKALVSNKTIGEDVIQNKDNLEFHSTVVVLTTTEEERPI